MSDANRYRDNRFRNRDEDRSRGGGDYGREGNRGGERDLTDRASDEVSSWFGDDNAARRRREDERRGGGYSRDNESYGSRDPYGSRDFGARGYGAGSGSGGRRDASDDYNRDYGQRFGDQGGSTRGGYGREYDRSYGSGHGREGYRGEERGFWDRASDEVSSWFGDDEAARRRREDEARDHRGRGPKGYTRSDDRVREQICDRLTDDPRVDASDIDVAVSNGEVTLSGTVGNRDARRRAEDIAESVAGDKHVQNNLRVNNASYGSSGVSTGATAGTGTSGATGGLASAGTGGLGSTGTSGLGSTSPGTADTAGGASTGTTGTNANNSTLGPKSSTGNMP